MSALGSGWNRGNFLIYQITTIPTLHTPLSMKEYKKGLRLFMKKEGIKTERQALIEIRNILKPVLKEIIKRDSIQYPLKTRKNE